MNDELIVMSCENSLETFLFGKSGGQTWCLKYTGHDLIEKLIICQEMISQQVSVQHMRTPGSVVRTHALS